MDTIPHDAALKQCNRCKQFLPLTNYAKDRSKKDGLHTHCKACKKTPKSATPSMPEHPSPNCMFIYVLVDPETLLIRYVGRTINPRKRLDQHTHPQRNKNVYLTTWVMDLRARGLKPLMQIIEEVSLECWQERECYWIAYYHEHDAPLTNLEAGGIGPGHVAETRTKMSASALGKKRGPMPDEHRQKIRDANKGRVRTPEFCAKVSQGKKEAYAKRRLPPTA